MMKTCRVGWPSRGPEILDAEPTGVALWKSYIVGGVTLLLGFPGGMLLASLNWLRMGRALKAVGHLAAGSLLAATLIALGIALPPETAAVLAPALALLVNTATLLYLLEETDRDTEKFVSQYGEACIASPLAGFFIGLLPLALLIGFVTLFYGV
jgi:hypothetical protein